MGKTSVEEFVSTRERMRLFLRERAIEAVTGLLCEAMEEQGVSRAELASRLNTTRSWVTQLLDGEKNKTISTLSDVFFELGQSLEFSRCPLEKTLRRTRVVELADFTVPWDTTAEYGAVTIATNPVRRRDSSVIAG